MPSKIIDAAPNVLICRRMPWKPRLNAKQLKRQADELAFKLVRTREALETSERRRQTLEIVLTARLNRISELNDRLERVREQARRLDEENDRLVEMIKFIPPIDATAAAK